MDLKERQRLRDQMDMLSIKRERRSGRKRKHPRKSFWSTSHDYRKTMSEGRWNKMNPSHASGRRGIRNNWSMRTRKKRTLPGQRCCKRPEGSLLKTKIGPTRKQKRKTCDNSAFGGGKSMQKRP